MFIFCSKLSTVEVLRCAVPIISAILIVKLYYIIILLYYTACKKFTPTKNDVLFDAFEVTCVFQLSHDTKIAVALVKSYRGSLSYRYGCHYVIHI